MRPIGIIATLYFTCIIFFSSISISSGVPLTQSTTITYQAHSFDDLGQWRQLIAKGANFIKVDVHYMVASICATQPRVLNTDYRGCFLLTHDNPHANETYYTAIDIIAFLIDPTNRYLFNSPLYLYLDFKNNRDRYPDANMTQSNDLQIEYIASISAQLKNHTLRNVKLVYDGVYYPSDGSTYPWARTYAFADEDLNNPDSCLYSNSDTCENKWVVNNMANPLPFVDPGLSISRMCRVGFGKYMKSEYPWVYYEPTDQLTVHYMLDSYLNCSLEHAGGFAISINIDPIQYQVYAGTRSGKAWNERLFDDAKWAHVVPLSSNSTSLTFLTLYLTKNNLFAYSLATGFLNVKSNTNTFPFGPLSLSAQGFLDQSFAVSPYQKLRTFPFMGGQSQFVLISDFRGKVGIYQFVAPASLLPVSNTTLLRPSESVTFVSSSLVMDESQKTWVEIQFLQGYISFVVLEGCSFFTQWYKLRFDPSGVLLSELTPIGEPLCVVATSPSLPFAVDSAALSVLPTTKNSNMSSYCTNSTHSGLLVVSSHKVIYGGVVCMNAHTNSLNICTDISCTPRASLSILDVGTFPSVSMATLANGEHAVLEVHGDGYCYNSDQNNKRAFPRVCNSSPVSSRYILNYNYGALTKWAKHIYEQNGMITSCDGSIFHGTYDEGSLPSAFIALDNNRNMRMVEAHSGFPNGAIDYSGCSWPVPYDGAMIDGITLPSVSKLVGDWAPSPAVMNSVTPPNNIDTYVPPAEEMTIPKMLCDMCKQKMFNWQWKYQGDYELIHHLTYKVADMCTLGRVIIGDGTVTGCKNLILLYVPSLAVDVISDVLSPENCIIVGLCKTNKSVSVLPDINTQVSKKQYIPLSTTNDNENDNENNDELIQADDLPDGEMEEEEDSVQNENEANETPEYTLQALIRSALKEVLLEALGLSL